MSASQKIGMDTPMSENTMLTLSTHVFCFTAASTPSGSASRMEKTAATSVRFSV